MDSEPPPLPYTQSREQNKLLQATTQSLTTFQAWCTSRSDDVATTARQQLEVMWRNATALLTKPLWSTSPWTEAWRCCSPWELWNDFLKLNFSVNMGSVYLQHHTKENPLENTCFHNSFTLQILINVGGLTWLGRQTQIFRITAGPEEKALLETQKLL